MSDAVTHIKAVLLEIAPYIQQDGGDLEFIEYNAQTGVVSVRLHGACVGCSLAAITLKAGVERTLKAKVPGVVRVEAV